MKDKVVCGLNGPKITAKPNRLQSEWGTDFRTTPYLIMHGILSLLNY